MNVKTSPPTIINEPAEDAPQPRTGSLVIGFFPLCSTAVMPGQRPKPPRQKPRRRAMQLDLFTTA